MATKLDPARLRPAATDATWLLGRGYAEPRVRHALESFERRVVARGICTETQYKRRALREIEVEEIARRPLRIDAVDVVAAVEAALAGERLLERIDGTMLAPALDRATYGPGPRTDEALRFLGDALCALEVGSTRWYVDRGAGAVALGARVAAATWKAPAEIREVDDVVAVLAKGGQVASSDPAVLDSCASWFNLTREVVRRIGGVIALRLE